MYIRLSERDQKKYYLVQLTARKSNIVGMKKILLASPIPFTDRKLLLNSIDEASKRHKDIRNQQREIANRRKQHPSLRRQVRAIPTTYKPELIMSSNRWMKKAGREGKHNFTSSTLPSTDK